MRHAEGYDGHADWYAAYLAGPAHDHTRRTAAALRAVLGQGRGRCLDVGCGTGIHTSVLRTLGWQPVGIDLSAAQLAHARREVPVVRANATRLPFASGSLEAACATLIHTDVADWAGVVAEIARVLQPGGRFAYVGVHPCFVGPFARRAGHVLQLHPGYWDTEFTCTGPGIADGVIARVGTRHRTLSDLIGTVLPAGMTLHTIHESGPGVAPDLLAFAATKPAPPNP